MRRVKREQDHGGRNHCHLPIALSTPERCILLDTLYVTFAYDSRTNIEREKERKRKTEIR